MPSLPRPTLACLSTSVLLSLWVLTGKGEKASDTQQKACPFVISVSNSTQMVFPEFRVS